MSTILKKITRIIGKPDDTRRTTDAAEGEVNIYKEWEQRGFTAPSPHLIKQAVVLRNGIPGATWVETGTYMGQTTELLSRHGSKVYSIEPEPTLYANAKQRFRSVSNVEILNGTSEDIFPTLVPTLTGAVSFWLDGHYSGDGTHKGPLDTPVEREMACIADNLRHMDKAVIMIDDIRLFNGQIHAYGNYPTLDDLVNWARANGLAWHIEQDIFIAKKT